MHKALQVLLGLVLAVTTGCSWLSPQKTHPQATTHFVQIVNVVDHERFRQGGKLLLVAFRAGPGVAATEKLNEIALSLLQAFSETLEAGEAPFEMLSADDADEAQLILEGHVTVMEKTGFLKRWLFGKKQLTLGIEGRITDRDTGKPVVIFQGSRKSQDKSVNYMDLSQELGRSLGDDLLSEMKESQI